ncbi:MAG: hypothetical protein K8R31_00685 [Bacteroidales bacterium]|nr:hypothetical protein [Bacteroidales bacterium]
MEKKRLIKKMKFHYLILMISIIWMFSSCSPEYIPNMVNSPMLSNQGEFQATIATGTSNFDAQTAFAITDNIGIMVNGSYGNNTNDTTDDFHKHAFIESGIGYYDKIGEQGRYEIYGGYGFGNAEGYFEEATYDSQITNAHYNRFFIQPGIGISTGIFDGSFSPRLVLLQMNPEGIDFDTGDYNIFIEPVFTAKIGFKYVKFVTQIGFSIPLGEQSLNFNHQRFMMNVGLNINLGRRYHF